MKPSEGKKKTKIQSRITLTTRYRLVKIAEADRVSGTQAISDLIKEAHAEYFQKGDHPDDGET